MTNAYRREFHPIVSSNDLVFYVSQTARGQMLIGAEFDRQPSYDSGTTFAYLQACARKAITVLPFLRDLRVLRQWAGVCDVSMDFSPIMGFTGVDGFLLSTGWGTWGFKAIPAAGEQLAELIATGRTPQLHRAVHPRPLRPRATMADPSSRGDPLMLWLTCPHCGGRPIEEFRFGGELPHVPDRITDPDLRDLDHVWMLDNADGPTTERWFHEAGCRRWHTIRRDTRTDEILDPVAHAMARPPDPVRRQELLDQVVRYLADHGLAGASLRPMAKALGVSLNGLVHHFGTKTDLLVAALARANELQQRESEGWLACNPALSQADLLRKWWRWINAAPEHLALVRLGLEAAALDATGGGLPGQVRAEQVGLWRTDIEQRLVAEGLSAGAAQVEASLVKAMFTGLVVDLIATGNRRRLTRALREGLHRLEAVVASARVGAVEQPARARPLAPPVAPCEPADLSPLVLVSERFLG